MKAEISARALYEEAATHCHGVRDYVSRDLFEKLMHDEEEHIDFLETQLDLVAKLGTELYSQHHIGKLEESKTDPRPNSLTPSDRAWRAGHRAPCPRSFRAHAVR